LAIHPHDLKSGAFSQRVVNALKLCTEALGVFFFPDFLKTPSTGEKNLKLYSEKGASNIRSAPIELKKVCLLHFKRKKLFMVLGEIYE